MDTFAFISFLYGQKKVGSKNNKNQNWDKIALVQEGTKKIVATAKEVGVPLSQYKELKVLVVFNHGYFR